MMTLLMICLVACIALMFTTEESVAEMVCATLALSSALAVPVGYAMGTF